MQGKYYKFGRQYIPSVSLEQYLKTYSPKCEQGDCINGYGIMTYPGDKKYSEQWKDGKKEGWGTYIIGSGFKYVGQFKNGEADGQGALYDPNGKIIRKGLYHNGRPVE